MRLKNISKIYRLKQILDGYFEAQRYNFFTTFFHNNLLKLVKVFNTTLTIKIS